MRTGVFALLVFFLDAAAAFAAEGHGGGGIGHLVPYWINFLVYVGILYYLLHEKAAQHWQQRRSAISAAIAESRDALEAAERRLREARERFDNIEEEIDRLRKAIEKDGRQESESIIADARRKAELIIERAHETIASERAASERALRQELAERVIARARERIVEASSLESDYTRRKAASDAFKTMLH